MHKHVWILTQTDDNIMYKVIGPVAKHGEGNEQTKKKRKIEEPGEEYFTGLLKDYFLMDIKLDDISSHWCKADENFSKLFKDFKGVRVLRQDPIETLFAFICSSNNNINRITSMVENLCKHFGEQLAEIGDDAYFAFPTIERLSEDSTLDILKDLRFGYRAKFIHEAAKFLMNNFDEGYVHNLRLKPYLEAKKELIKIPGVGAKVADCICLMSLDKLEAVPVDTHVLQIAERDYKLKISTKSLTEASYNKIGNYFRDLWGPYAGWAQSVVFSADLKKFQPPLKKTKKHAS